jgi:hypothetical protein
MFMILCVIDDPEQIEPVLDAWKKAGLPGITIVESTGVHRHHGTQHVPMRYLFGGSANEERGNYTLFSVVETEALIQRCMEVTESVIGSFDLPNTGVFTAFPLLVAKGASGKPGVSGGEGHGLD